VGGSQKFSVVFSESLFIFIYVSPQLKQLDLGLEADFPPNVFTPLVSAVAGCHIGLPNNGVLVTTLFFFNSLIR
jgi:hypothetical protein